MKYADVVINLPVKNLFKQFTYFIGDELDFVDEGWRVIVPFGHQMVEGFVVRTYDRQDKEEEIKEIIDTLDTTPWFDQQMLLLAQWISDYYMCSLAESMRLFIPGSSSIRSIPKYLAVNDFSTDDLVDDELHLYNFLQESQGASRKLIETKFGKSGLLKKLVAKKAIILDYEINRKIKEKTINVYNLSDEGKLALKNLKRMPAQRVAMDILFEQGEMEAEALQNRQISQATLRILCQKGWVLRSQKRVFRDSYANHIENKENLILTSEQTEALVQIKDTIEAQKHSTFLLQGVTGSGKTEIYLRAAAEALLHEKQVMVLVPEIALTGQIVERFKAWFGKRVAVVHSKLSQSERADVWYKMRTGYADILIGVRSAVFAPFLDLGLIIMDEEQEYSYKQEERPSYNARTISLKRAQMASIPLLLGSATPDICTYFHALKGRYQHLHLTKRANESDMPDVTIVDMREELQSGNKSVISRKLRESLLETVKRGEQAIVLLNRRGFSTFVMCRDCGESIMCPHCAVALVYHSAGKALRCHYCGFSLPIPDECPSCHSRKIKYFGTGTQKAEAAIEELDEEIKILRMDQDSTARKFAHEEILHDFAAGKANVLLGTQMVAKGHDIANVTLVGILAADSQLNLPDFRAGEKTFNLLTQAAGRAGRGGKPGHVVLQTYDADNEIIKLAARQDYDAFAKQELLVREELLYPPFTQLLKITIVDRTQNTANVLAQRIVNYLQTIGVNEPNTDLTVMGPFPGIVEKVRDLYRINILVKSTHMAVVKNSLKMSEFREMKNVYFDVDPISVV